MFRLLLLILTFWGTNVSSQSLGLSPNSYNILGDTEGMSEVYFEYKVLGFHYFHSWDEGQYLVKDSDEIVSKTSSFAVSVVPVDLTYFRSGVMFFQHQFPVTSASRVHFLLEASLPIRRFTVSYRHISNGFGLLNDINPGVDSISLKYRFGE